MPVQDSDKLTKECEAAIYELLDDPIFELLLKSDKVTKQEVVAVCNKTIHSKAA